MKTILFSKSLIVFSFALIAVSSFAVKPSNAPTITRANGYLSNKKLIIMGTNFSSPVVNLDNTNLVVTSSTSTTINADLPPMIMPGSYHLRVTSNGQIATLDLALDNGNIGNNNTSKGVDALASLTTGEENTAVGAVALFANTSGNFNDAFVTVALSSNVAGIANNAFGELALYYNQH